MTDRELLELAAKAAGIKGFRYVNNEPIQGGYRTGLWSDLYEDCWNPLTDDGDALRLAVDCRLFEDEDFITEVCAIWLYPSPNKQAAVRRAIVRAAAEIGRSMK